MKDAFISIFGLILTEIVFPIQEAIGSTALFDDIFILINDMINGLLNLFREVPSNVVIINPTILADLLGFTILIFFIGIIYSIFKFVYEALKNGFLNLINNKKRKVWRKQWKR